MKKRTLQWLGAIVVQIALIAFLLLLMQAIIVVFMSSAFAAERIDIPEASALYRHRVEQVVSDVWGVDASSARLAAQLHQESRWNAKAHSSADAYGIAQFTLPTAKWMAKRFPQLAQFDPWDATQSILAAALYDKYLFDHLKPMGATAFDGCSHWNFTLRSYNGGEGWMQRDRTLALAHKADANDWKTVERYRTRGSTAQAENIAYPRRILLTLEPAYIAAGWSGAPTCS